MKPKVLFVVGPTACGKSDFAVEAAEQIIRTTGRQVEIINCDSVQFIAEVNVGAAKPSAELMSRVPHHLIGHVPIERDYTAGMFRRDALEVITKAGQRGVELFIAVGGSGFYIQALEKGMYDVPTVPAEIHDALISEMEIRGPGSLHAELAARDPESAAKIKIQDRYRILRALEILRSHPEKVTLGDLKRRFAQNQSDAPFTSLMVGLSCEREKLQSRIRQRTHGMLSSGLVEEVRNLYERGLRLRPALKSVGYREVGQYLNGELTAELLPKAITMSTMQLAKKQMTWFKRAAETRWFETGSGWSEPLSFLASVDF